MFGPGVSAMPRQSRLKPSVAFGTSPKAKRRGARFHHLREVSRHLFVLNRSGEEIIFLHIKDIRMSNLLESAEEIAGPTTVGAERKRTYSGRTNLNLVGEQGDLERTVEPETFQEKVEWLPGIEEGVATRDDNGH